MNRSNIASRAARWSAGHRRTAILGWIAFVVLSLAIGSFVGTQNIADEDQGNGDSRTADRILAEAGFPDDASEQAFIQARADETAGDPGFRAAIRDDARRASRPFRTSPSSKSPLEHGNADQISADGRSALITFELRGDDDQTVERVAAAEDAVAAAQRAHPELRIEEFGDASLERAASASLDKDFQRAEFLSLPITLLILVIAFGALVAAGRTAAARADGGDGDARAARAREPAVPGRRDGQLRGPAGRPRRRRRLLAVLPASRARRAADGPLQRAGAGDRGRDLRARRARLRDDRGDRDGRHVPDRQRDVHVVRARHDHGRRRRGARLADRAPRRALEARRPGREGTDPVPRPPPSRATASRGSGTRSSIASCAARPSAATRRRGVLVALAIPALADEHQGIGRGRAAPGPADRAHVRPDPGRRSRAARCRPWSWSPPTTPRARRSPERSASCARRRSTPGS